MNGDDKGKIKSIMPENHKYSFTDSVCFDSEIVVAWLVKGDLLLMMFKTDEDEVLFRLFISVWTCVSFSSRIFRCCYKKQWSWMKFWEINKQFRYSQTSKKNMMWFPPYFRVILLKKTLRPERSVMHTLLLQIVER